MSHIDIDVDTALTQLLVNQLPLVAKSDGTTISAAVAFNAAGMDLNWNFITSNGAYTQTNVVPTSAGVHDWVASGNGMYTIEVPATGGTINNDTEGFGWFTGETTAEMAWSSPIYRFRAAALNDAMTDGGDVLDTNVIQVAGTAQTANDNGADINAILAALPANLADLAIEATTGIVDANVEKINNIQITGNGSPGTEFSV